MENPNSKLSGISDTYYQKNRDARMKYQKQYYENNKERIKAYYSKEEIRTKRVIYMRDYHQKRRAIKMNE